MKFATTILIFLALALAAPAQTGRVAVITTNYVSAAPNYREFHGGLYNADSDPNWSAVSGGIDAVAGDGDILVWSEKSHGYFILKNYSGAKANTLRIYAKAVALGTNEWIGKYGGYYPTYDCGLPHRIMIYTTNYVAPPKVIAPTNLPVLTHPWES